MLSEMYIFCYMQGVRGLALISEIWWVLLIFRDSGALEQNYRGGECGPMTLSGRVLNLLNKIIIMVERFTKQRKQKEMS